MMLTKEQILSADDRKSEVVEVPEWGGSVRVSVMSAKARDMYDASLIKIIGKKVEQDITNARAKLLAACIVDDHGKTLFSSADVEALGEKSTIALERVAKVAARINGLTEEAIEDSVKN